MVKLAAIDLGTNTFHLLIVEKNRQNSFREVYRQRNFIHLGEEGIHYIGEQALQRARHTILGFKSILKKHNIENIKILGTEALRRASNGPAFVTEIENLIGYPVEIISGMREAELIYKGVALSVDLKPDTHLIMDIGGGSVEFIITQNGAMDWAKSFPIGISVLNKQFHNMDPISRAELDALDEHLKLQLDPLLQQCNTQNFDFLTGSSGSFEVIGNMIDSSLSIHHSIELSADAFFPIYRKLLDSTYQERLKLKWIPDERAKMIVVAVHLIYFILQELNIRKICVSQYALKEGALAEMMS